MTPESVVGWLVAALLSLCGVTISAVVWGVRANSRIVSREMDRVADRLDTHSTDIKTVRAMAAENGWTISETKERLAEHAKRIERLQCFANQVKATHNSMHPEAKINGL